MRAKFINESLEDIFVPKSEQEIKDNWRKRFTFSKPTISRVSKDGRDVELYSKTFYSDIDAEYYNDLYSSRGILSNIEPNKWIVNGIVYVGSFIGWKMMEWNEDGSITFEYSFVKKAMSIDPLSKEELDVLHIDEAK